MLGVKGKLLIVVLFAATVFATGRARLHLDHLTEPFRNDFREMLYLPRGIGLKLIACGFDTPIADALFIKSLVYYGESMAAKNKDARRLYTFELFDVITDLSPRFHRAYQVGGLFLSSSADMETNLNAVRLMDKGVSVFTRLVDSGEKVPTDPRWLFHLLSANTYEVNIQARYRANGDLEGASETRRLAAQEFLNAAKSPGAPGYVIAAAAGYESVQQGRGNVEEGIKATLAVWQELYAASAARGDKDILPELESRITELNDELTRIAQTREIAHILSEKGKEYITKTGKAPVGVADLVNADLIPGRPITPMSNDGVEDLWLAMPDGAFKSVLLSNMETQSHIELLFDAMTAYRRAHGTPPPSLQTLVDEKYIAVVPEPPLKGIGQVYDYNPSNGRTQSLVPLGPMLPPDRR